MQLQEAISLVQHPAIDKQVPQLWADLGCGGGLFTAALSAMLHAGSTVYAVDKHVSLKPDIFTRSDVSIKSIDADFVQDKLPLPKLHGLLMANALHYVQDKPAFLSSFLQHLLPGAKCIIVEYDTVSANRWVPYPINFKALQKLFMDAGFSSVEKYNERPSIYNSAGMYAAMIS